MFQYYCLNPIAQVGLEKFTDEFEKTENANEAQGILVRSAAMHDMELSDNLLAVARAGAGVNNIPLDKCAEKGIVVFNTPGANANGVKELVIAGMLLASRDIVGGINWVESAKEDENIAKATEWNRQRIIRILPKLQKRKRNALQVQSFRIKSWESSVLVQLALRLPMLPSIWEWKCMAMIPMFP